MDSVNAIIPQQVHRATPPNQETIAAISKILTDDPTTPAREIARELHISPSTSLHYIYDVLRKHRAVCQILPHQLTQTIRKKRILYAKIQLAILEALKPINYCNLITLDESWFFFSYFSRHCYISNEQSAVKVIRRQQGEKKILLTIAVNGNGLVTKHVLDNGKSINSEVFTKEILQSIADWWKNEWQKLGVTKDSIIEATQNAITSVRRIIEEEEDLDYMTSKYDTKAYQLMPILKKKSEELQTTSALDTPLPSRTIDRSSSSNSYTDMDELKCKISQGLFDDDMSEEEDVHKEEEMHHEEEVDMEVIVIDDSEFRLPRNRLTKRPSYKKWAIGAKSPAPSF